MVDYNFRKPNLKFIQRKQPFNDNPEFLRLEHVPKDEFDEKEVMTSYSLGEYHLLKKYSVDKNKFNIKNQDEPRRIYQYFDYVRDI